MLTRILAALSTLAIVASAPDPGALNRREGPTSPPHRQDGGTGASQDPLKDTLVSLERQSWQAWQRRDGTFFQDFLSDDHVEIGFRGITRKAAVVTGVASPACIVRSFTIDSFDLTRLTATAALLTYHAAQETLCRGHAVPSPVWASSLYVHRGGRWLNAVYQQTQVVP